MARELATGPSPPGRGVQIVERQTRMGRSTGEAVREMARRFDLEELRSLAGPSSPGRADRFQRGHGPRGFAESLREKRQQHAEEMAQKAGVKLLFPTVLFIFPGIFIVILGPAAIQIYNIIILGVLRKPS